jgi:hypothetical protein
VPTIQTFAGFEWGTVHDVQAGNAGTKIFDGVTGTYGTNLDIVSGSGSAIGSYVGQVATIANKNFFWDTNTLGTGKTDLVVSLKFRFTSFPTSDNDFHSIDTASSTDRAGFYYEVATGKIHAWITTAHAASSIALTLNTWYTLQFHYGVSASLETMDWVLNGTTQTQVTNNLGASTIARYAIGNRGGSNGTLQVDDVAVSTTAADHPLPNYNIRLVSADTGGTTTEIGTANSTARFTTNNTLDSTHNSANILAAISEVPPTIGATASGVAQRAGGASDALSIPMTTFSLGGDTITACKVYVCGWANGTAANNLGIRAWNGSAETVLVAGTVASSFSNSTTDPDWFAALYAGVTNQTTLDALEIRLGYSTDIAPEPGAHAVYAEILTLPGTVSTVTPNGITSNEQFGSPSVTPGSMTLAQSGIGSGERFGSPTVTSSASILPSGIVSSERFGTPTISATANISPAGIPSSEQPGSASVTSLATISPVGIKSGEQFGSPAVLATVSINGAGVASSEVFGAASVTPGAVTVSTAAISSGEQIGSPAITPGAVNITSVGIITGEQFGSPVIFTSVAVTPSGVTSGERFGQPTVSAGTATATPGTIGSSESFGAAGVSAGPVGISPGSVASGELLGSPTVAGSGVGLAPSGITSSEQFGSSTVIPGVVTVNTVGITSAEQFGSPAVTSSSSNVSPSGIVSTERFGSPAVTPGATVLLPLGIPTGEQFGSPSIAIVADQTTHPAGVASGERFGSPNVTVVQSVRYGAVVECKIDRQFVESSIDREVVIVELRGS